MKRFGLSLLCLAVISLATAALLTGAYPRLVDASTSATSPKASPKLGANPEWIYAITTTNILVTFNSATPGTISGTLPVTGLQPGETILGIDFRPATAVLYALGSTSRLYTINIATGAATQVGTGQFSTLLSGTEFGFDFNPVVDRIRVVSDADQNLRLNPDTGTIAGVDVNLAYAAGDPNAAANPNVVGAAYTNNGKGATTTTLFDIDSNLDILARQGSVNGSPVSPNAGQLFTIGGLGADTSNLVGFDISQQAVAYASLTVGGVPQLYTINLTTGAATLVGQIGGSGNDALQIRDIAVQIACILTCPANITVSNDPNQCGAVVNYPAPTPTGDCGTVTCSPASGSFFPVGTTTVTCTTSTPAQCTFTITVIDTQPPTITCPANVTIAAAPTCPLSSSATATFPPPTASDNCPGVTTVCNPPSGSTFPVGTTTVTCTATDASGNTATCSFTVTVFSGCVQDDSNPTIVAFFNAMTGQYQFCCGSTIYTGTGRVSVKGCIVTIEGLDSTRRVTIKYDGAAGTGSAFLQDFTNGHKCSITDRNVFNNTCTCGAL
jgi:hypothetical protein